MTHGLFNGQKGGLDDIKKEAVDDNGRFLEWEQKFDENNEEYFEAKQVDEATHQVMKTYRIKSDEPPKPQKKVKVEVI